MILQARQKPVLDIPNNGHFVSICSHRRYGSLPSAHSACRDLFAVRPSFSCGHLLMGSPCRRLYGTRKWSEWAFNYFIVNAGCREGKDMIGFDERVTEAAKKQTNVYLWYLSAVCNMGRLRKLQHIHPNVSFCAKVIRLH